ncbi:MFS transporter [bacterium]|nr:MFS transporter [bacterium]
MNSQARPYLTRFSQFAWLASFWFVVHFIWATLLPVVIPAVVRGYADRGLIPLDELGTRLGLVLALGAVVSAVLQLTIGFVSDSSESRYGRRKPYILIGALASTAAVFYLVEAPGYWHLVLAYMLVQVFLNTASVPYQSMMPDLVPERYHGRAAAMMGIFDLTGKLSGLIVAALVISGVGIGAVSAAGDSLSFAALGVVYCVLLLGLAFVVLVKSPNYPVVLGAGFLRIRFGAGDATSIRQILREYARFEFRRNPEFVKLAFSRMAILLGYYTFIPLVYYFCEANLGLEAEDRWMAAALLGSIILGAVAGNLAGGYFSDRIGKRRMIFMGMAATILFMFPVIFATDIMQAIYFGAGLGVGWGAFIAADWAFAFTLIPKERTARYMGVWDMTSLAPQMVAPLVAGVARDYLMKSGMAAEATAYQLIFTFSIIYFVVGLVILGFVREYRLGLNEEPQ